MRLLKKQQVNIEAASERKAQIDEGMALARRIDALRHDKAELETQQIKFIAGMQVELKGQLNPLISQIAELTRDIKDLEEQKKILQIPLDVEWDKVNKKLKEVDYLEGKLKKGLVVLTDKTSKANERYEDAKFTVQKINVRERELNKVYETQEAILAEITNRNIQSIEEKERLDKYIEEKDRELLSREGEIAVKEREVGMARDQVERDRRELINRTALIQDREQTLERELKRQQK